MTTGRASGAGLLDTAMVLGKVSKTRHADHLVNLRATQIS
jgi:hypothetical protein